MARMRRIPAGSATFGVALRRRFGALACIALLSVSIGAAPNLVHAQPERIVQSGHSLTDGVIAPLQRMIRAAGLGPASVTKSTIPGSPMDWRWNNPATPDLRSPDGIAVFDLLVLTERVPLSTTLPWHGSAEFALRWVDHAWRHGNAGQGAPTLLYATWVNLDSGPDFANPYNDPEGHIPFRDRLPLEAARWREILDHVNDSLPAEAPKVRYIPGPEIMARVYDAIEAGTAPGLTDISDLFEDQIHLNTLGNYLIALAHFAVIFERDPSGLPHGVPARGGASPEQAAWMQALIWDVLENPQFGETNR